MQRRDYEVTEVAASTLPLYLETIQVLRHQRGGWVGSEKGNSCRFTVLQIIKELGGWA